jgi:rod shape-determining protein MreC
MVLALLVVASVGLLTLHFGEGSGGPLHTLQRGVVAVLSPVQEIAERALKPARDTVSWFDETFEARGENSRLREELADVRKRLAGAETATQENRELRRLVDLGPSGGVAGLKAVTARVIGRSPTVWYSTVTIDKGSSSGVRVDDPAVTGDGLVGRVTDVTAGTARVTLITDHTSAVSAKAVPEGIAGVVRPEVGDPEDLLMDFIERDREVNEGQTVVTSGSAAGELGSLFPYGIPIGRVTRASLEEQQTYQRAHIKPFADLRRFDFVKVLT